MATITYLNFDLHIERTVAGYRAQVLGLPASEASADFTLPFSEFDPPNAEAAKSFGACLFRAVFVGTVRKCLRRSLKKANQQGKGLRIRLRLADVPALINLPWEYLYDPVCDCFFCLSEWTPLVRYLKVRQRVRPLAIESPLRVLAMISNPADCLPLDPDQEWSHLQKALRDLEQRGRVALERLESATEAALQRRLRRGAYHVFHFAGHGSFDEQAQDSVLILEDEQGRGCRVSGQSLGALLHGHRSLRLVLLNTCESARSSPIDPLVGVAQRLVRQGIPAVIAMQRAITGNTSVVLAHEFYAALADGCPVDAALAEARKAIFSRSNDVDWGTPVLYMRAPDGQLFDLEPEDKAAKPISHYPPFQAPPDVPHFTGREKELKELGEALTGETQPYICCLTGMGGIGKTALATRIAHLLRDRFPDGVLWGNAATSDPLAILDSWAQAYGCNFSGLPDLHSRAKALGEVLANKRVLAILDDVRSVDCTRPLLLHGPQCATLLTSRGAVLAAALDAHLHPLATLTPPESRRLMANILKDKRVTDEKSFADEICELLGHLPLAVEIVAQRLRAHEDWKLAGWVERLRNESTRLRELKRQDKEVRASFALSWEALDEGLRCNFALLAIFGGRAFTVSAFASVAGLEEITAESDLCYLVDLSLLSDVGQARYRQHPLLADFAREHLEQCEENPEQRQKFIYAKYASMVQYYLEYTMDHQDDFARLEQEWENLLAAMQIAYQQEMWPEVIEYSEVLTHAWFARGRFSDARQGYKLTCEAAQALKNRAAWAACLCLWGRACIEQSDYAEAEKHLSRSLQMCKELGERRGVANAQYYLGRIAIEQANFDEARRLLAQSRLIRIRLGDMAGIAEILYRQARIQFYCGDYAAAERLGKQALDIQQSVSDKLGCVRTLNQLASIALGQRDICSAEKYCQHALALCQELDEQGELATTLFTLSEVYRKRDAFQLARDHAERSLALLMCMGDRKLQAQTHYQLSMINAGIQDYALALREGVQSLDLCRELQDAWGAVYVLLLLGDVHKCLDQPEQAQEKWAEALGCAKELRHPLTETLRERLGLDRTAPEA